MDTHYHGILIRAAGNVHTHVADRLFDLKPPPACVLDIAAGNGALTARLIDAGYDLRDREWDVNPSPFELDIPCAHVNLDDPFAEKLGGPYDAIVCDRRDRDLESPSAFLRGYARELLAPDGVLIVSTPNLESAVSRVSFLTRGCPSWFGREEALGGAAHQPAVAVVHGGERELGARLEDHRRVVYRPGPHGSRGGTASRTGCSTTLGFSAGSNAAGMLRVVT